jgi:3-oxoadipate enol-lactonase
LPVCPPTGIAYDRAGPESDTTVVLIHAGIADRRMWNPQWPQITADHDTVRIDLRGYGESTTRPTRAWAPCDDVIDTLEVLDVHRAHLVGCSFGAGVAVEVALARPELVASMLLCSPGGALIPDETEQLRLFIAAEDAALAREDLDAAAEANMTWWVDGPEGSPDRVSPQVREVVHGMQRRAFEITADWDDADELETELDPPALERLGQISVPTLILTGGLDLDAIADASARLAAAIPHARTHAWHDTAHLPSMEQPEAFASLVADWLSLRA